MALIECEECQGKVSSRAAACPHCGCPTETYLERVESDPGFKMSPVKEEPPTLTRPSAWWPTSQWGGIVLFLFLAFCALAGFAGPALAGKPQGDWAWVNAAFGAGVWYLIVVAIRAMMFRSLRHQPRAQRDWDKTLVSIVAALFLMYGLLLLMGVRLWPL